MTLKTAITTMIETKYIVNMKRKSGEYDFVKVDYLEDISPFCKTYARVKELSKLKNKVRWICFNSAEKMIEIDCVEV